jgi:type III secretion protein Y
MDAVDPSAVRLLHVLGYLYGEHGQTKRAIAMLLIATRLDPNDIGVLRTLAHTFIIDGSPDQAMLVLDRLRGMDDVGHPALELLTARALWASGRELDARRSFQDFLIHRGER